MSCLAAAAILVSAATAAAGEPRLAPKGNPIVAAGAGAVDQDAVCAFFFIDMVTRAKAQTNLPPATREALPTWGLVAQFFSGVVTARYDDARLGEVLAAAISEYVATKERSALVRQCTDRYDAGMARLRAGNERAREKLLGPRPKPD
jgi:hypothetical protein